MKDWLVANYQWTILVLLSIAAILIAITIAIKQINKSKIGILHNERLEFYTDIREYYELVINSSYNTTFSDFSREKLFNSKFFFKGIHKEIEKFIDECDSINKLKHTANKLFSSVISSDEIQKSIREDFEEVINGFHSGDKKYTIESLKKISKKSILKNTSLDGEKARDYNYYELYIEREKKKEKLKEEYKKLSKKIEKAIK